MTLQEIKNKITEERNFKCWKHKGLTCIIYRFRQWGHWCGYVGIPKSHKLYGKDYNDEMKVSKKILNRKIDIDKVGVMNVFSEALKENRSKDKMRISLVLDAHGGLTFSGKLGFWDLDNKWFFGFDTAHAGDFSVWLNGKSDNSDYWLENDIYRDKEYVIKETNNLAEQLYKFK